MTRDQELELFNKLFEVISKYSFRKDTPEIVDVLGKMAGTIIGQITAYSHSDESSTRKAVFLLSKSIESAALFTHRGILNEYKSKRGENDLTQ